MGNTEWRGESAPETNPATSFMDTITGLEYDGWPLRPMTRANLYLQGQRGGIVNYVWPHEGQVDSKGFWTFHKGVIFDGGTAIEEPPTKPLMIDGSSARAFMLVWDAINEKNRDKTEGFLASRGLTVWMFDKLIWPNVGFGRGN